MLAQAIAAVSNLALGLEVFLKMHHFQTEGKYPRGHDIGALATSFEPGVQQGLRSLFLRACQHHEIEAAATIKIAVGEEQANFGASWPEEAADLDTAALLIGRAYERWRYIYEELDAPLIATIAFKPLISMVSTFDLAIREFRSAAFVSVGSSAV